MEEQDYETIDLREIFLLLKKHLLALIAVTVLFALLGYLVSALFIAPKYEASATMIVNSREDASAQTNITSDQINTATKLVDTYSVILTSDTVLDKTIEDLGLDMTYKELLNEVTVESVNSTQVMKISVVDTNPQRAQQIVQSIVDQAPDIIIQTVKAGSVEVISQPKAGEDPVSPKKMRNAAIVGMVGLLICFGIIFLRTVLNNKFMNETDITKKLGLTVLGVIPQVTIKD